MKAIKPSAIVLQQFNTRYIQLINRRGEASLGFGGSGFTYAETCTEHIPKYQ